MIFAPAKIAVPLAISLVLSTVNAVAEPADDEFEKLAKEYIAGLLEANPEYATELGDHRFDDRLTDYSAEAVGKELERARKFRQQIEKFNDLGQLNAANRVDVRILRDNIDNEIFGIEELKEREWNPLVYNQSLANSLYLIVARDFAPAAQRLPNLRKRMEKVPAVLAQAKTNL